MDATGLLQNMTSMDSMLDHDFEKCGNCYYRYLMAQVARDILSGPRHADPLHEWTREVLQAARGGYGRRAQRQARIRRTWLGDVKMPKYTNQPKRLTVAAFWSDGVLEFKDRMECRDKSWAPIMIYRRKGDPKTYVPVFDDMERLSTFIKRNVPKEWMRGGVSMMQEEIDWCESQGWELVYMTYPNRLVGNKDYEVGFEVMEYQQKPEMICRNT